MKAIVLAGRRYRDDAPIRTALQPVLEKHRQATLVCSAAAGADLVALDLARTRGMSCRVVIPSDIREFRAGSVADRGQRWLDLFDEIVGALPAERLIRIDPAGEDPYDAANTAILDEGLRLAGDARQVLALIVWNGRRESGSDYTESFMLAAQARGFEVTELRVPE